MQTGVYVDLKKHSDTIADGDAQSFIPHINFPKTNIKVGKNMEVGLKRLSAGFIGTQRFEEGTEVVNMPGQVIEQWIDAVLKEEEVLPAELLEDKIDSEGRSDERTESKIVEAKEKASKANATEDYPGVSKV